VTFFLEFLHPTRSGRLFAAIRAAVSAAIGLANGAAIGPPMATDRQKSGKIAPSFMTNVNYQALH
jgi:hypothetical protein